MSCKADRSHGKTLHREKKKDRKQDTIEFVVIKTEGKSIRTESGILSKNSSAIKKRIREAEENQNCHGNETNGDDLCTQWLYGVKGKDLELHYPGLRYKDVKMAIDFLSTLEEKREMSSKLIEILVLNCLCLLKFSETMSVKCTYTVYNHL